MPLNNWNWASCAMRRKRRGAPTKRATDALILARTGQEPRTSGQTMRSIRALRQSDPSLETLRLRYATRQSFLHGACFYDGICEPEEDLIADIRETADYIRDAEALAGYGA